MVGLLASQGCVHPICHRRVRVSVLAIGDQLVGPAEAPILHRERNATNLAVSALILAKGAMVHDLGCVTEADAAPAIDRATTAPVVLIIGDFTGGLLRRLARDGVEPVASGLDLSPGATIQYGVMRDDRGFPTAHLLLLPLDPVAAVIGTALLALPLIARLQGGTETGPPLRWARLKGGYASQQERTLALPARLIPNEFGVLEAELVPLSGERDLPGFARANALALIEAGATVEADGLVRVVPLGGEI
jgi:molybdopterin molybdotransferase